MQCLCFNFNHIPGEPTIILYLKKYIERISIFSGLPPVDKNMSKILAIQAYEMRNKETNDLIVYNANIVTEKLVADLESLCEDALKECGVTFKYSYKGELH